MGRIERPKIWKLQFREDPGKHVVIQALEQRSYERFYTELAATVGRSEEKEVFVFIHGYHVTFEDAALRTGQLAYDLGFDGAPVMYTWPSQGKLDGYLADETNAEWTAPHLLWFLQDLARKSQSQTIHVIAHSMGNRPLLRAMHTMASYAPEQLPLFHKVALMAPDIDADVFRQLASGLRSAKSTTLYASDRDRALELSKTIHGYRRAGEVRGGVTLVPGMDTIDVSSVDTSLLGHAYYGDNRSVLSDLFYLLRDVEVAQRQGIKTVGSPPSAYYQFVP